MWILLSHEEDHGKPIFKNGIVPSVAGLIIAGEVIKDLTR